MNNDWMAVFEALNAVYTAGAYSNISINEAVSRHRGCRESFVRTFAKGVLRESIRIDFIIDTLATKGIKSIKARPLIIIRMGIYAADMLDSVPDHAAVNEAVSLAKRISKGSDKFINGMLRSYLRRRSEFDSELLEPHIRYSISEGVFSLLTDQYGGEAVRIAEALNRPSEVYLRTNTLKTDRECIIGLLKEAGIEAEASDENPEAIKASGAGIAANPLQKKGAYTIQSLSSMIAVNALAPPKGSKVLDICAAPGGKTGYMAEMMQNTGSIIACDIHPHRLDLIRANMDRIGATIVECREMDGSMYDPEFEDQFDYVLADVPCSGLGVIAGKPEIKLNTDPDTYPGLNQIQKSILKNALRYVKPGGRVMYSTCTINKDENEQVVKHVLNNDPGLAQIIEMNTLLPYNGKVGFFYSIIEKNAILQDGDI